MKILPTGNIFSQNNDTLNMIDTGFSNLINKSIDKPSTIINNNFPVQLIDQLYSTNFLSSFLVQFNELNANMPFSDNYRLFATQMAILPPFTPLTNQSSFPQINNYFNNLNTFSLQQMSNITTKNNFNKLFVKSNF